ncbi:group II intron reverse transcriptase/maturase [Nocardia gipuzkoensis]
MLPISRTRQTRPPTRPDGTLQPGHHQNLRGRIPGIIEYYLLAYDVFRLARLHWVMETSMLKTLAGKHRSTVSTMARKSKAKIDTPVGKRTCFQVVDQRPGRKPLIARFGGIPLRRKNMP